MVLQEQWVVFDEVGDWWIAESKLQSFGWSNLIRAYYFIVVFFNVGLVYCARLILEGEETSFAEGISYAMTRTQTIFAWAALAATVGMILKTIQEKAGPITFTKTTPRPLSVSY